MALAESEIEQDFVTGRKLVQPLRDSLFTLLRQRGVAVIADRYVPFLEQLLGDADVKIVCLHLYHRPFHSFIDSRAKKSGRGARDLFMLPLT